MYKIELHFHTAQSSHCGRVPAEDGVRQYKEAGYSGLVVTDHFSERERGGAGEQKWDKVCECFLHGYRHAKQAAEGTDFQVLLGMEIRFPHNENDFLVYGFTEEFIKEHPWIYMKELPDFRKIAEKEGLYIVQAHPFRPKCVLADIAYLDGIEVYNGNPRHDSHNALALQVAREHDLGMTVGSDFHQPGDLCEKCAKFVHIPRTEQKLAEMLRRGEFKI